MGTEAIHTGLQGEQPETIPNISVDCVIFGYDNYTLKVLLRREFIQYQGKIYQEWKLPGNHVRVTEMINDTASRILKEQTGLENIFMKQFKVFSDPNRLKRRARDYEWIKPSLHQERVITVGFYSLINVPDIDNSKLTEEAAWQNAYEVGELIFDHKEILDDALSKLRGDLLHEPLGFELLPEKFTLTQLQRLYEAIFNTTFDKRNFRRKINKMDYLVALNELQKGVSHKPAMFYTFDRNKYENSKTEKFDFRI